MNNILDSAKLLRDKIWFTRKSWINAESRLLSNDFHTQFLMVVYSVYSVCLSVILLKYNPISDNAANIFSVNLSVVLLGLALYLNTRSFKDRAQQFKNGYIKLQDIDDKLNQVGILASQSEMVAEYNIQFTRYNLLLGEVENHTEFDDLYSRYRAGPGLTTRKLGRLEKLKIFLLRTFRFFALTLFYVGPMLAFIFLWLKDTNG